MVFKKAWIAEKVYSTDEDTGVITGILNDRPETDQTRIQIDEYYKLLALCHSVFAIYDSKTPTLPKYQGPSPDELALVEACADVGYVFTKKT